MTTTTFVYEELAALFAAQRQQFIAAIAARPDLTFEEINVPLGACWVPVDIITAFLEETIPALRGCTVRCTWPAPRPWSITPPTDLNTLDWDYRSWGTSHVSTLAVLRATLNGEGPRFLAGFMGLGLVEMAAFERAQERLREHFAAWLPQDPERVARLTAAYNERFNRFDAAQTPSFPRRRATRSRRLSNRRTAR